MTKTDNDWFFLSIKLLSGISDSLERVCKVKLRTEKALGFIKDRSCLTRPVSPQCLSVPSPVQRDSMSYAVGLWISLVLLEECSGTWCDMAAACSAPLLRAAWGKVCAGHGRRSVTARPGLEIEGS